MSIRRSTGRISTPRTSRATQGAPSNYKNLAAEPADHGIGRSRGGLSTKIHHLVDVAGMPLVVLSAPGQAGDAPMFPILMGHLKVNTSGSGTPPYAPDQGSRRQGVFVAGHPRTAAQQGRHRGAPQPDDQIAHRRRRGSAGGRPPAFDAQDYKGRTVVERSFQRTKQWRGIATRYDKHNLNYRGGAVLNAIVLWLKRLWDTP
ncbi:MULTISPECIES: transposase [Mycobacterium]|uniref:transposase n=1 Tax=Mycobacterium TaxID=1763 RepID=UPI00358EC041